MYVYIYLHIIKKHLNINITYLFVPFKCIFKLSKIIDHYIINYCYTIMNLELTVLILNIIKFICSFLSIFNI